MKIIGNISVQLKKEIRVLILAGIMISFTSAASAQDYLVLQVPIDGCFEIDCI